MNPVAWSASVETTDDDLARSQLHHDEPGEQMQAVRSRHWPVLAGRLGVFIVCLGAWQLAAGHLIDTFYLPTPMAVLAELMDWITDGSLLGHITATLVPAVEGFVIATLASLLLGYALAMTRFTAEVLEPYIAALYGIPIIAIVPLMILWFGIGEGLAIAVAALASFFLMFYNVYFGIREVSQALIDQVMIAGGSRWDIAVRVRLPSALVWVIAGMKVAVPHSIVGVVVAEFLTGSRGLGFLLSSNASQFNAAGTFAAVAVLATITFLLDRLMFVLTRRALLWKDAGRHH
jgi:NitT/TauT family transport system permease protein